MKVRILEMEFDNIRGLNSTSINFTKSKNDYYPVSLIMMPNGTGKTTTLNLLRAIFDGEAKNWVNVKITDFKPLNSKKEFGKFSVKLLVDNDIYHVILELNYKKEMASYKTTKVPGGSDEGHLLPDDIKDFFSSEFVKRFVLDGELAQDILESDKKEAHNSIKFLYQLNRLEEIRKNISNLVEEERNNADKTSAKSEQGLSNLKTRYKKKEAELKKLYNQKLQIESDLRENKERIYEINEIIRGKIEKRDDLNQEAQELDQSKEENKSKINSMSQTCLNLIRNPYTINTRIAERLDTLSNKLQKLKLPDSTSREFFIDIAEENSCICGRNIGPKEREEILRRANDYLADDQSGVINAIKSTVRARSYSPDLRKSIDILNPMIITKNNIKSKIERLQIKLEEAGDTEVTDLHKEKAILENKNEVLEIQLELLITKDKIKTSNLTSDQNIPLCEASVIEAKARLDQAANTVKISRSAEMVNKYFVDIESKTLRKLKQKILLETNKKIKNIITDDILIVESIDEHLKLKNKSGASMGQTLALAYSFLGSMFDNSSHQLPLVVDSPAGALDLDVRREVSKILPELFDQIIIFITSGEKKAFVDHFSGDPRVYFLTIFRDKTDHINCHEGEEFFMGFQD